MDYTISISDELIPGIVATAYAEERQPSEVIATRAEAMARKACEDYKVGPYFIGSIPPQFNADGTPYVAPEPAPEPEPEVVE
jgi:hypothetical protein